MRHTSKSPHAKLSALTTISLLACLSFLTTSPQVAHASTFTTIDGFSSSTTGFSPSNVIRDSSGDLYGTTQFGGTYGYGTIWEVPAGTSTITTIASFTGTNGSHPYFSVTIDGSGNLYGTTTDGGTYGYGTVWEIAAGTSTITDLFSFNGTTNAYPASSVVIDSSGNLYGTSLGGGPSNFGGVWKIAAGTGTFSFVDYFTITNGVGSSGNLVFDGSGNLYGTTTGGGASSQGVVWKIASGTSTIAVVASFNGTNGSNPYGGVTLDGSGNIYGTTESGGASGDGVVWEIASGTSTITDLASFNGTNGNLPQGPVTFDSSGNIYGTTSLGGAHGVGVIWRIAAGTSTITDLFDFNTSSTSGATPTAPLVSDSSGNLYGTTFGFGGTGPYPDGTVFEFTP